MTYRTRPGIVKTEICGVHLLVPTREAAELCPNILRLKLTHAIVWDIISREGPVEDICRVFSILTKKPDKEVRTRVQKLLDDFCEKGFLIRTDENAPSK